MRKIYGSKFSSITSVPHAHFAYAICDFLKTNVGGRVMPVSVIRIYLLNDLYARAFSVRLTPSAPNLMSPCAERGCSTFRFIALLRRNIISTRLCSIHSRISNKMMENIERSVQCILDWNFETYNNVEIIEIMFTRTIAYLM